MCGFLKLIYVFIQLLGLKLLLDLKGDDKRNLCDVIVAALEFVKREANFDFNNVCWFWERLDNQGLNRFICCTVPD